MTKREEQARERALKRTLEKEENAKMDILDKEFAKAIRIAAKKSKYKVKSDSIFKIDNDLLISASCIAGRNRNFYFLFGIKKYSYDAIFWDTLEMRNEVENLPNSFRAIGVGCFVAPSVILEYTITLAAPDDVNEFAESVLERMDKQVAEFTKNHSINEYVLEHDCMFDPIALKILAHIDMGDFAKAKLLAEREIEARKPGKWWSNGVTFNSGVVAYCNKRMQEVDCFKKLILCLNHYLQSWFLLLCKRHY